MSTSKLQRLVSDRLSIFLGGYTIRENIRPKWLRTPWWERLELDFYIEELDVAIEVQGKQHYQFVPYFHGDHKGFKDQLKRDRIKRKLCESMGLTLYEIASELDLDILIQDLYESANAEKKTVKLPPRAIEQFRRIHSAILCSSQYGWQKRLHVEASIYSRLNILCIQYGIDFILLDGNKAATDVNKFIKDYSERLAEWKEKARVKRNRKNSHRWKQQKRKRRAKKILCIEQFSPETFKITGGESHHVVVIDKNGKAYCDCQASTWGETEQCSHVWRYHLTYGGKPPVERSV